MASEKKGVEIAPSAPTYEPPQSGIVSYFPASWVPYAELMRLDKPAGIYLFYLPHLAGTLYAACVMTPKPSVQTLLEQNIIFFIGTVFMRGAACSWNDNLDQEYDRQVFRCKTRPIARGAVSTINGHIFTGFLSTVAFAMLLALPQACLYPAVPSIFLLWLYPFGKRFTDYPQIILGIQISIGFLMGLVAMGMDLLHQSDKVQGGSWSFYASLVAWTVVYDTVYARQDIRDDAKAGVKSMAVLFQHLMRPLLCVCASIQVGLLVAAGWLAGLGTIYYVVSCGGVALSLFTMIMSVKLDEPADCMWWFKNACWHVGIPLASGLIGQYSTRL